MPNLLLRNPFNHHHHHHHQQQQHEKDGVQKNNTRGDDESEALAAVPMKASGSFLGFMNRGASNDSQKSNKSLESAATGYHTHRNHPTSMAPTNTNDTIKHNHSMAELRRFFRPSMHKKAGVTSTNSNNSDIAMNSPHLRSKPSPSALASTASHSKHDKVHGHKHHTQSAIPPSADSTLSLSNKLNIYHDDSILAQKYGKLGKLLGSGAGGSVKILVRPSDNAIFAVKEFRPRKSTESVKDYAKKCTAEFLIGSTLHDPNIIETLDIFSDSRQNKYYEVMQYCPVDFFAVVMTGKMSRGEINCCLKQLCRGVRYLHSKGLAHRDLKLDNCVMTEQGILKLIDFGSAVVFKYPFEQKITMAHGIVGSDPYLAPEVITSTNSYDPQYVDVWSLGIIYCCLVLKRFPWKAPRPDTDENYKLFCMDDDVEHDYVKSAKQNEKLIEERRRKRDEYKKSEALKENIDNEDNDKHTEANKHEEDKKHISEQEGSPDNKKDGKSNQTSEKDHDKKPTAVQHSKNVDEEPHAEAHVENVDTKNSASTEDEHRDKHSPDHDDKDSKSSSLRKHQPHHRRVIHGPYRLLRLLPHASRPIISQMLQVDPKKRASIADVLADDWVVEIPCCTIDPKGNVQRAAGHHHTIVTGEGAHMEAHKV